MQRAMSRLRTFVHSLKFRLTLGAVAALAVGMGVVALLLVRQTERDTLASQREHQVSETVRTAQVLARRIFDLQRALQVDDAPCQYLCRSHGFAHLMLALRGQRVALGLPH